MSDLDELLGLDASDPLAVLARRIREEDDDLLAVLVNRRRSLQLSQGDVAERMDTDQATVSRIESGTRDLKQSTLRRYAMALEVVIEHTVVSARDPSSRAAILQDVSRKLLQPEDGDDSNHYPHADFAWGEDQVELPARKKGRLRHARVRT
ncbi:helix-turn-helix transcriptional regulator [Nocardioides sp. NPDC004968]|uniref:helix-turn-helix domain-containing protein n=1 Tax=Nocardioides sp. NPDC004968 TaxID=3155894 RepID=UPI0033B1C777